MKVLYIPSYNNRSPSPPRDPGPVEIISAGFFIVVLELDSDRGRGANHPIERTVGVGVRVVLHDHSLRARVRMNDRRSEACGGSLRDEHRALVRGDRTIRVERQSVVARPCV